MKKLIRTLTLVASLLLPVSGHAVDKVVVIPMGAGASTAVQENTAAIITINARQRLTDTDTGSLLIESYNEDIATGMSINVQGRGRDILIIASINVNNTVNTSVEGQDVTLEFDVRFDSVVRRTETIVLKADSRQMFTLQWLEPAVPTTTHTVDVIVSATNRVNLENRFFYVVEL